MALGRARYQGRIAEANAASADAQADQHTSEQMRDEVKNADNTDKEATGNDSAELETNQAYAYCKAREKQSADEGDYAQAQYWRDEAEKCSEQK